MRESKRAACVNWKTRHQAINGNNDIGRADFLVTFEWERKRERKRFVRVETRICIAAERNNRREAGRVMPCHSGRQTASQARAARFGKINRENDVMRGHCITLPSQRGIYMRLKEVCRCDCEANCVGARPGDCELCELDIETISRRKCASRSDNNSTQKPRAAENWFWFLDNANGYFLFVNLGIYA